MILLYKYDFQVHDRNHCIMLSHLKEKRMKFQNHWKESHIHFRFSDSPLSLFPFP